MTPDERQKLKNLIIKHEGFRDKVYTDTTGHLTLGYGHNIEDRPITQHAGSVILDDDLMWFLPKLTQTFSFFNDLDFSRKSVLIDMAYNLGLQGLLEFKEMLEAIEQKDYEKAAKEMLQSRWAAQVGARAIEDAYIMEIGEL